MTDIVSLDQATISKIAAGEVVERPASVAKELVENSLDADATRIDVNVEAGGTEKITVADDGTGMTESAVKAAVEQHTTSKIGSIEDLESGLTTLGFRGEALYTIGAVSKMTVTTRPRDGPDVGTELRVEGGEIVDVAPAGRAPGTTVRVGDLFFNTPARRKYLKRDATEFAHLNRVVTRYALANPDVAISLVHDENEVFGTSGRGDLQETILSVYGRDVAQSMIGVEASPEGPIAGISGYVSDPETTRSASHYVSTYVNGRYVREPLLREAVVDAYGNQLAPDRYPFSVLFLEVPPETVDVNVHPRKMEVRFDDDAAVREGVETAVREALLDHGLVRTSAPRGRSAPDDATITPGGTAGDSGADEHEGQDGHPDETGPEEAARSPTRTSHGADDATADSVRHQQTDPTIQEGADTPGGVRPGPEEPDSGSHPPSRGQQGRDTLDESAPMTSPEGRSQNVQDPDDRPRTGKFEGALDQAALTAVGTELDLDTLPPLSVLGQVQDTYIVAESPDGIVLIDQHAADERINYERLQADLADQPDSQRLVEPVELEVTPEEASLFDAAETELEAMGFEVALEGQTVEIEAVPAVYSDALSTELVREVLATFLEDRRQDAVVGSAADALLADMACYPAITGNTSLKEGDVVSLLEALDACENPYSCPHGRPVVIELSSSELEARFERDYPGHATRRPEE